MKRIYTLLIICTVLSLFSTDLFAGNKDRAGQAGASQLLMNPWARSAGLHGMNNAIVRGVESLNFNPAGLAFTEGTEIVFANTMWLVGSDVKLNSIGLGQRISDTGVLGLSIFSMSVGEIPVTTVASPEALSGATFRPQMTNIALSYSQSFSNSIHVGFVGRLVNESIADVKASGFSLDMGIQYVTGPMDNIRFGIALRNIGTPMRYDGDGLAYSFTALQGYNFTANMRSEKFELPTVLNLGGAYDFRFGEKHRLTAVANFTSNSFTKDHIGGGIEYAFSEMFMIRGGYRYHEGITGEFSTEERSSAYTGLAAGVSVEIPISADGPKLGVDYGFRTTSPFNNTHTIGVRINL